jgi:AcrR family transcriptional regulator
VRVSARILGWRIAVKDVAKWGLGASDARDVGRRRLPPRKGSRKMVGSSNAVTTQRRDEILDIAARQLKQNGVDGVTIPEVMGEPGMAQGGSYTHFASKSDLAGEAMRDAVEVQRGLLRGLSRHQRSSPGQLSSPESNVIP